MTIPLSTPDFNRLALRQFCELFGRLAVPEPASLLGTYRAAFVGPGWLRTSAGPVLAVGDLGGCWGKGFFTGGVMPADLGLLARLYPLGHFSRHIVPYMPL